MKIVRLTADDIPKVLETSCECGLCLWSAEAYRSELARDDSIMLKAETATGAFAGFAVGRTFDIGAGRWSVELTNIGIRQAFQGQHFGSHLLRSFLAKCREFGASSVILEVRESNKTARRFYERFGFTTAGRRNGFYSDPTEDALTMKLQLDVPAALRNSHLINNRA